MFLKYSDIKACKKKCVVFHQPATFADSFAAAATIAGSFVAITIADFSVAVVIELAPVVEYDPELLATVAFEVAVGVFAAIGLGPLAGVAFGAAAGVFEATAPGPLASVAGASGVTVLGLLAFVAFATAVAFGAAVEAFVLELLASAVAGVFAIIVLAEAAFALDLFEPE